jgi:hypothetical protein
VRLTLHGMTRTPEHNSYCSALGRCNNPNGLQFHDYGGRGIQFRYLSFEQFLADLGPRPPEDQP